MDFPTREKKLFALVVVFVNDERKMIDGMENEGGENRLLFVVEFQQKGVSPDFFPCARFSPHGETPFILEDDFVRDPKGAIAVKERNGTDAPPPHKILRHRRFVSFARKESESEKQEDEDGDLFFHAKKVIVFLKHS